MKHYAAGFVQLGMLRQEEKNNILKNPGRMGSMEKSLRKFLQKFQEKSLEQPLQNKQIKLLRKP